LGEELAGSASHVSEFYLSVAEAARLIQKRVDEGVTIRVVSHIDADGLTSASIIGRALHRCGAEFRIRNVKQIDPPLLEELSGEEPTPIVFTDLGSGSLELLKTAFKEVDVIVLDHHQPLGDKFPKLCHVNPHLHGFDGARDICSAGVCYLTAKALDGANTDLAEVAVVGALGDSQDRFGKRSLGGLNDRIVKDAVDAGCVRVEEDLMLYGRETRPIHRALAYTTNPFIPGLSGEEDKCLAFVTNMGLEVKKDDRWRAVNDLSSEEKKLLFSELAKYMAGKRLPSKAVMNLIGTIYTLINEDRGIPLRDGREYASLLNACGRMSKTGLGVIIGFGNRLTALDEAMEVFAKYKKALSDCMEWVSSTPRSIEQHENIYVINGSGVINELMLSTVASIITSSGLLEEPKPIVAITEADGGMIKVSGRLPDELKDSQLNLGTIFHEASENLGGIGGGHDVAAGAQFSKEHEVEFIKFVNDKVGEMLQAQKG
jgi:single-stranded-DNA-specific exonuclease